MKSNEGIPFIFFRQINILRNANGHKDKIITLYIKIKPYQHLKVETF